MTTTWPSVRSALTSAIQAVRPALRPDVLFAYHEGDQGFAAWAVANSARALRHFEIANLFVDEFPGSSNADVELVRGQHAVTVAYPLRFPYGRQPVVKMDEAIDSDRWELDTAIGHRASLANFAAVFLGQRVDLLETVALSTLTYLHEYWRTV